MEAKCDMIRDLLVGEISVIPSLWINQGFEQRWRRDVYAEDYSLKMTNRSAEKKEDIRLDR
ncbi:hypothetical protein Tco_1333123, partial [Tanacetum coccineum]